MSGTHHFDRPAGEALDGSGRVIYACSHQPPHPCSATEIRRPPGLSPLAVRRAKRRLREREERWDRRSHA